MRTQDSREFHTKLVKENRDMRKSQTLTCKLFGHRWGGGCECLRCGAKKRHRWYGCTCTLCTKTREESHYFVYCKCAICGRVREDHHRWYGCKCNSCGMIRDQDHQWSHCKCGSCGKIRDEEHDWNYCKCNRCGKYRNYGHDLVPHNHNEFERAITGKCRVCGEIVTY